MPAEAIQILEMAAQKSHAQASTDLLAERGLPANPEAEKLCLGSVILDDSKWELLTGIIGRDSFMLEAHKRIFSAMVEIKERGERIHRVSIADELMRVGHLESVGGLTALIELDEGLPEIVDLASYARIVLEKAHLRAVIYSSQKAIEQALSQIGPAKDIAAAVTESLSEVQAGQQAEEVGQTAIQVVESYPGGISAFLDPTLRKRGLLTGYRRLDDMTDGFHDGELIVIGARPGVGKSSLLLNIAENVCLTRHKREMWIFSLEMVASSLVSRIMCSRARVDQHKFRTGYLKAEEREALHKSLFSITESNLRIVDRFGITIAEICKIIRRAAKKSKIACVGIDYLQLAGTKAKGENRNLEISDMTRQLKILAGECEMPVIVLSQLSRSNEKRTGSKKPILSDLRDGGSIEQDADMVMFLHREEFYSDDEKHKGVADLILAKQRHGPLGTAELRFLPGLTRFENKSEDAPMEDNDQGDLYEEPPPPAPTPSADEW